MDDLQREKRLKSVRGTNDHCVSRLLSLAHDVRRIGCGYRSSPESIAIQKDDIAAELAQLARELEAAA